MSLKYQTEDDTQEIGGDGAGGPVVRAKPPYYTYILIGSIVVVAVVQLVTGLNASIEAAGFDKPLFLRNHEYWRIFTGATTHGGIPEAVTHERTGLLVSERDDAALFAAMQHVTAETDILYILGQAAARPVRGKARTPHSLPRHATSPHHPSSSAHYSPRLRHSRSRTRVRWSATAK